MPSPTAPFSRPRPPAADPFSPAVEAAARNLVLGGAGLARSALRGVRGGVQSLRSPEAQRGPGGEADRARLLNELEEARRLGSWHTEEDRALVREHEARLAAESRAATWKWAGRRASVALLVVAWFVPPLWPLAIIGSFLVFPRTSRRVLLGLLGFGAAATLALLLLVGQWLRGADEPPSAPPLPSAPLTENRDADLGRTLADRLVREADYWEILTPGAEGPGMLRKGVFRSWGGRPVMVLPRPSWQALTATERRALADHLRRERGVEAIHVGQLGPSSRFQGQAITVEERVWP